MSTPRSVVTALQESLRRSSPPDPLTPAQEELLHQQLSRVSILSSERFRVRGQSYTRATVSEGYIDLLRQRANVVRSERSWTDTALVEILVADLYWSITMSLLGLSVNSNIYAVMARNDVDGLQRLVVKTETNSLDDYRKRYERALDYKKWRELDPTRLRVAEAVIRLGDILYEESDLGSTLDLWDVDWRMRVWNLSEEHDNADTLIAGAVRVLSRIVENREEATLAPTARPVRKAADRADRSEGRLDDSCAQWTYDELEAWTRWSLNSASPQQLCGWLTRYRQRYGIELESEPAVSDQQFEDMCRRVDLAELRELVVRVIRMSAKSVLCDLLARTGAVPPELWSRESFKWFNLELRPDYLPLAGIPTLLAEMRSSSGMFFGITLPEDAVGAPLAGAIAEDIRRQGATTEIDLAFSVVEIDADRPVGIDLRELGFRAFLGLEGSTLVSVVGTGQERAAGTAEADRYIDVEQEPLQPFRVLLEPGTLLLIRFDDRESVRNYDYLVLRSQVGSSRILEVV